MTLKQKAREMRNAIDSIELALNVECDLVTLMGKWDGVENGNIVVRPKIKLGELRQIVTAFAELNRIINDPAYLL